MAVPVPVIDKFQRHNFPTSHAMDLTGLGPPAIEQADLILLLDNLDAFGSLNVRAADHQARPLYRPGTKLVRRHEFQRWSGKRCAGPARTR